MQNSTQQPAEMKWNPSTDKLDRLLMPLSWRKPRKVFVNSMSDLFWGTPRDLDAALKAGIPDPRPVPFEFVDRVFAVMALCPRHTFQILTKRPERMAEYLARPWPEDGVRWMRSVGQLPAKCGNMPILDLRTVLPNVWLGTSVENRATLERVMSLRKCPAAVRFLSIEPLLEDLGEIRGYLEQGIDWVIVGGESGPGARPCRIQWIRDIVKQCKASKVPVFVKQLGSNSEGDPPVRPVRDEATGMTRYTVMQYIEIKSRSGSDPAEWPEDLRVREFPEEKS